MKRVRENTARDDGPRLAQRRRAVHDRARRLVRVQAFEQKKGSSILHPWRSIRFRLPLRHAYDATESGVRVDELAKPRRLPAPVFTLPLFYRPTMMEQSRKTACKITRQVYAMAMNVMCSTWSERRQRRARWQCNAMCSTWSERRPSRSDSLRRFVANTSPAVGTESTAATADVRCLAHLQVVWCGLGDDAVAHLGAGHQHAGLAESDRHV